MTSVFDEKKKKDDEMPTGNELDAIFQLRAKGTSLRDIARQSGYSEKIIKSLFPGTKKTGPKKPEAKPTFDEIKKSYVKILNEQKKAHAKELGENPSSQLIIQKIGKKELHRMVLEQLHARGWEISDSTLRRNFAYIDFEKEIQGETKQLPHEIKVKAFEQQEEFERVKNDKKWIAHTTPQTRTAAINAIKYINELISWRHGKWENIEPEDVDNNEKIAKLYHEAPEGKEPVCAKPNPVPINEWAQDDLMWALLYIDWCGETGQYNYRIAINRLLLSNPKLLVKDKNPLEHMDAIRKHWVRSTYHKQYGVSAEEKVLAQEPKTGKYKKPPSASQVKAMFQVIKKKKFEGKPFRNLKDKNGKTVKLSTKELEDLERSNMLLAISIAAKTGMRGGHLRQTEMGSLTFDDIHWNDNQINCATKTSKREKVLTDVEESVIADIKKWKEKLESKGIDTSQMHIIHMPIQSLNDYLREVAEEAGICQYVKQYGEYRTKPGSKGKKYLALFDKSDPRYGNPKYLKYQRSFQGHTITINPSDPDPHLHLFRAFHLWQLALAGIPLEYAIKISYGWDDPKTAIDCYLAALTSEKTKEYAKREKEIFSAIV